MDLSILIPSRNEMFLSRTIDNILQNIEGDTEIISVADGAWPDPPIKDHPRVTLIHHSESIGQRAATNEAANLSTAKFILKCDAHCAFDKGFDIKLMADCEYDWTVVPRMYNLHAFDWQCKKCGDRRYQGPTPTDCPKCHSKGPFERVILWKRREHRRTDHWRFDKDLHFQYWGDFGKRPEAKKEIAPTMSLIGAAWFMHRQRYWELDGMDEKHGSWGQMGTEIACKTWLSGGKLLTNKKTWFAHLFRTQGGDFSFPYPMKGSDQERARRHSRNLWLKNQWPKAKYPLSYMIQKFWPVPGWDAIPADNGFKPSADMPKDLVKLDPGEPFNGVVEVIGEKKVVSEKSKALVYYTDNHASEYIYAVCRKQLLRCMELWKYPIISVSQYPIDLGKNIVMELPRAVLSLYKQVVAGLEATDAEIVFLIEHDVLYHPSHFDFTPPREDTFYYDRNRWPVSEETGKAIFYQSNDLSLLCAYRSILLKHFKKAVYYTEKDGFKREFGFSPPKGIPKDQRVGHYDAYMSTFPNVDIRHENTFTRVRMNKEDFRSERSRRDWTETDGVEGWGKTLGRFGDFMRDVYKKGQNG